MCRVVLLGCDRQQALRYSTDGWYKKSGGGKKKNVAYVRVCLLFQTWIAPATELYDELLLLH